jgi:hypothetical protein
MHHPDTVLLGKLDNPLEKVQFHDRRRRVVGEVDHQHLRLRPGGLDGLFQFLEEIHPRQHRHMTHVGARDDKAVGMDGISRTRYQHRIAGPHGRQRQMGNTLFRADGDNGF